MKPPATPLFGDGLVTRVLAMKDEDVVWLRGILEAYEGLAGLYGDGSGDIVLFAPVSRERELDEFLNEIGEEIPLVLKGPFTP